MRRPPTATVCRTHPRALRKLPLSVDTSSVPVTELIRKHGISRNIYFNWKSRYSGAEVSDLGRLKELEAENAKLKKIYSDLALENAAIKDPLARKR